mmetsp:Transcript_1273/g.1146  ORF Transcript_1273/g.1146 Transcript_1273/m.1146 type:complete len:84 (+) Transcript_1273:622-873(+)
MNKLHENYVLMVKIIPSSEERGIKNIISIISKEIKILTKAISSDKSLKNKEMLKKLTFEKLLIQLLFDGPDLTFSPSRYNKNE